MKETKNSSISLKNTGCGVFATHVALSRVTQRPVRGGADINNWPPAGTGGRFPVQGGSARLAHLGQGHQMAWGSEASTAPLRSLRREEGPAVHSQLWGGASPSHPRQDTEWPSFSDTDTKQIHTKPDKPSRQGSRREETRTRESKQAMTALQNARTAPRGRLSSGSMEPDVQAPIMSRLTTATPGAPPRQPHSILVVC